MAQSTGDGHHYGIASEYRAGHLQWYRASCPCGWKGEQRALKPRAEAEADFVAHAHDVRPASPVAS